MSPRAWFFGVTFSVVLWTPVAAYVLIGSVLR